MVCRTVQNLPLDHASMCRMAFEEAPLPPPVNKRSRGRPRTTSLSAPSVHSLREQEDEDESEQRLRLREQMGASSLLQLASASTADLSVLADVALKMDPDAGDSEETETSDEAEEQKMEASFFSPESLALVISSEGVIVLMEHNYCKPPVSTAPPSTKRTSSKDSVLLPADLNTISGVLEAPEEVIGEAVPSKGDAGENLPTAGVLCESEDTSLPPSSKKIAAGRDLELEKDISKKRRRKDKENLEILHPKKPKETQVKKQRKRKLEVCGASFFFLHLFCHNTPSCCLETPDSKMVCYQSFLPRHYDYRFSKITQLFLIITWKKIDVLECSRQHNMK